MKSCYSADEPECDGFECEDWGKCQFSKTLMDEDISILEEWEKFKKENNNDKNTDKD